jgi:hypothetical protein
MHYKKLNNITGWAVFLIATIVYFMTLESTASLWDCGEYITAAYKLEVGHPPGAPFFMVLGRLFSFFAAPEEVALWINRLSALCSSFTILFMYWSITMLGKKIMQKVSSDWSTGDQIAVISAGVIGSLAYTFSDSFWFSAVEGEVYAMSSLFTAIIFWAILKWDSEMGEIALMDEAARKNARNPLRWIILLVLILGLSIGVHLLGLLVIPAVIYIIYFRLVDKIRVVPFLLIGLLSLYILNLVQEVIIPNTVGNAALSEVTFVNSFGFGFNIGTIFYFLLLIGSLMVPFFVKDKAKFSTILIGISLTLFLICSISWVFFILIVANSIVSIIIYNNTKNTMLSALCAQFTVVLGPVLYYGCFSETSKFRKPESFDASAFVMKAARMLNVLIIMILIGYGTFAVIVIRSNANTPLDENDPENLVTLHAYLKREQYGTWPILNGPYWNSFKEGEEMIDGRPQLTDNSSWGDLSPFYLKRYVVQLDGNDIKAFKHENLANEYARKKGAAYSVTQKYFSSNEKIRIHGVPKYRQTTFLPRMYYDGNGQEDRKVSAYKRWSGYVDEPSDDPDKNGTDGLRLPTFGENLTYMGSYQINWMYWRYFMWNFAGRQNDIQGYGDAMRGNYLSGIKFLDEQDLGSQEFQPSFTKDNPANNKFFLLPLVLGILGLLYHVYRDAKGAFVVFLLFLLTGLAIVIYLNQKPEEPRERDYAYAASFYAFAIWIGFGVLAMYEAFKNFVSKDWMSILKIAGGLTGFVFILTLMGGGTIMSTYLVAILLALGFIIISLVLRMAKVKPAVAAVVILLVTSYVPYLMGSQGWDDHNRHEKTSARDLANNYLMSCKPNSILFTVGDNDTFPLWYLQEVEGKFTDIRVCNTSLFGTDWYTEQMKMKAYDSEALPIKFREDQTLMYEGQTDQILFASTLDCLEGGMSIDKINEFNKIKIKLNKDKFIPQFSELRALTMKVVNAAKISDPTTKTAIDSKIKSLSVSADSATEKTVMDIYETFNLVVEGLNSQTVETDREAVQQMYSKAMTWEKEWAYLPIDIAMDFARNDDNILTNEGNGVRAVPCLGFHIPVDKENAVKSGIITEKEKNKCAESVILVMDSRAAGKSDLMILDMLANNDWKRAMYFSSPGGTEVGMSLYHSGFLRQNGMAWEVSPIKVDGRAPYNVDAMYDNLMNRYEYGAMNKKGVLTDYYARRQTGTVRGMFAQLADYYLQQAEMKEMAQATYGPQIQRLRAAGNTRVADSLANSLVGADKFIKDCKKRAIALVEKSISVMPIDLVIDYGEPSPRNSIQMDGIDVTLYNDGTIQNYVSILFRAGATKEAEKLGMAVTDQLESTLRFFYNSDAKFAVSEVLSATMAGLLEMHQTAKNPLVGAPNGKLFKRLDKLMTEAYDVEFIKLYQALGEYTSDDLKGAQGYPSPKAMLSMHMDAVAYQFEYKEIPQEKQPDLPMNMPEGLPDSALNPVAPMDTQAAVMDGSGNGG